MWEWAIDDDVSDGCDFGNRNFCLNSLLFAWDQALLIVSLGYSLSLTYDYWFCRFTWSFTAGFTCLPLGANTPNPQFMPSDFGINCFLDVRLCFTQE